MAFETTDLDPGLYLVATPIGAARDITLRALDILASADALAAEDTRVLRRLMRIHGIPARGRRIVSYHDHNGARARPGLLSLIARGKSVAYATDAGTPLVADPGFRLVRAALDEGHAVVAAPGPSAALAALTVSGLPTDRFLFAGFPPAGAGARRAWLDELLAVPATLVVFESARRARALLEEVARRGGAGREAALCREITKRFEEVARGTAGDLARSLAGADPKGELALVIGRGPGAAEADGAQVAGALGAALETMTVKDAVARVSRDLGVPRRRVYQAALALGRGDGPAGGGQADDA